MNTPLQQAAQELVDRIADLGASPLDWPEYTALEKALEAEQAQAANSRIASLYEELRKATDGGSESMTHDDALKQIEYWQEKCNQVQAVEPVAIYDIGVNEKLGAVHLLKQLKSGDKLYTHPTPPPAQQVLPLDLLERLSKTLINLGYSTPEGGMEHFGARIESQLYNLCRGVDSLLAQQVAVPMPMTDEQIQKIWDVASGSTPGWCRHITYARALFSAAQGAKP